MDPHDSPAEGAFRAEAWAFLEANAQPLPATALSLTSIVAEWSPQEEVVRVAEAKRWQAVK
ncbi:MAG: acyl-CoA dehydrogenase, partial [Acidimicrobiia bacterium]|nr:acyl-CoA dehydrogenase [Acidimicrobiia bacterium]